MNVAAALLLTALLGASASPELLRLPGDVAGAVRGIDALATDPAAIGRLEGGELQWRQEVGSRRAQFQGTDLRLALPLGPVTLAAGYAWQNSQAPAPSRGSLGLSVRLRPDFWLGLSGHHLHAGLGGGSAFTWDAGLAYVPAVWASLSVGINGLEGQRPDQPLQRPRALRLGLALRPDRGRGWLTLAGEVRLGGPLLGTGRWQLSERRALLDLAPLPGLHVLAGWRRGDDEARNTWWLGLGLESQGVGLFGAARQGDGLEPQPVPLALTLRHNPRENLLPSRSRAVSVSLEGNLQPTDPSLWQANKVVPMRAWQLAALAQDQSVDTVVLHVGPLRLGLASIDELRAAIAGLRAAGKQVVAELRSSDSRAYALAAAADVVHMDPLGTLRIDGFALSVTHLTQTLGRFGVRFDAVAVGRYKNFADALTLPHPRPETREVETALLAEAQALLQRALAQDRHLSPAQVAAVFEQGILSADDAMALGLVDGTSWPTPPAMAAINDRLQPLPPLEAPTSTSWRGAPRVAVVPIVGTIVGPEGAGLLPGPSVRASQVAQALAAAEADPRVVGVVLRIDSPGGDVEASEAIWRAVGETSSRLPLVVSMGDVAASGGYYAAMAAPTVLAQPNTITGSIGIVALQPDLSGLLRLLAVERETFRSSPRAGWDDLTQPLSADDRSRVQRRLDALYSQFVARVATGRHLSPERVRSIAEGRVYTGAQAHALGLVDGMGGLADAVALVAERAGLAPQTEVALTVPDRATSLLALARQITGAAAGADAAVPAWAAFVDDLDARLQLCRRSAFALLPQHYEVAP